MHYFNLSYLYTPNILFCHVFLNAVIFTYLILTCKVKLNMDNTPLPWW